MSLLSACSGTRTIVKPTAKPETSYKLITPAAAPHYTLQTGQSAILPKPVTFAPPTYPAALAHPGMPRVTVKAQLAFDAQGNVANVYILSNSYAGAGHALFDDAVRAAAKDWSFTPLVFQAYTGSGKTMTSLQTTTKPFSLWYAFTFDMVNGKPVVVTVKR